MPDKKAFTLMEVLIAILLFFSASFALIKVQQSIMAHLQKARKQSTLLPLATPLLTLPVDALRAKEEPLYRYVRFPKLRDDEIFFLKQTRLKASRAKPKRETLFETLKYNVWPVTVTRKNAGIRFIRITP